MTTLRLPSFNDFSPEILKKDIRTCLNVIPKHRGNDEAVIKEWADLFFGGAKNKRSSVNLPATLTSTGLCPKGRPFKLSAFGISVAGAPTALEAARLFCTELIKNQNGMKLIEALREMKAREVRVTKKTLKDELKRLEITNLSAGTTDHTTLKNWMFEAGILTGKANQPEVNDAVLKSLLGISATEHEEFGQLTLAQQIFLQLVRRRHVVEPGKSIPVTDLLSECLENHPHLFDDAQFARTVSIPLAKEGWIELSGKSRGPQGGKSGDVKGSKKLLDIPVDLVIPDFDQAVPSDLRQLIATPLHKIEEDLFAKDTHLGGIALELLALRMIIDLGLHPRNFRLRSRDTAHAEVDLTAEGDHLLFSRWSFQCKRVTTKTNVALGDVAKEVGIAIFTKAHVVVMVTTSDFSRDAYDYAAEISKATHLQFLFITGKTVRDYLERGKSVLHAYVGKNAKQVMAQKRGQALSVASEPATAIASTAEASK